LGLERVMASAKLSPENSEFLYEIERNLRPYEVSQSSLVNLAVTIVRRLYRLGDLNLEPKALQDLLCNESLLRSEGKESTKPVPIGRKR
jgi:hypothetical protein